MRISIKNLINYIAVFTVFTGSWTYLNVLPFAEFRIFYLIMFIIFWVILSTLKNISFNKTFLFVFYIFSVVALFNIYIGDNSLLSFLKQFIGITISSLFFYILIKFNNYDVKKLFAIYLNIVFIIALIGIFQELTYLLKFDSHFYSYGYIFPHWKLTLSGETGFLRVNSILPEPSQFSFVMQPAFFVSLVSLVKNNTVFLKKWKCVLIVISYVFTLSTIGYLGIFFSILLIAYINNKFRFVLGAILTVILAFVFLYSYVYEFRLRIDESMGVLSGRIKLEDANVSTFTLYSNALVTYKSFKRNPLFGAGLGSYETSYNKYIKEVVTPNANVVFVNYQDASSLFFRLLSETGLFGLLIFMIFIFKFYLKKKADKSNYFWIINNAILTLFFIRLIRYGHYFNDGFFLFFWLYYFSKIESKSYTDKDY